MIRFPYADLRGRKFPVIPLFIKKKNILRTQALVDSGANISLFDKSIAEYLEVHIKAGKKISLQGIGGKISAYVHPVSISVATMEFTIPVAFCERIDLSFNILGREGFFEKFLVCFDERRREIILK